MKITVWLLAAAAEVSPDGSAFLENACAHMITLLSLCFHMWNQRKMDHFCNTSGLYQ